jgi:hypothetical protein
VEEICFFMKCSSSSAARRTGPSGFHPDS